MPGNVFCICTRMAKHPETVFVCQNCGNEARKWIGQCPDCREWDTFVEERFRMSSHNSRLNPAGKRFAGREAVAFQNVESQEEARIPSGIEELDRVLGGGIVAGSIVLIGGAPGIGKSTLAVQMADKLSSRGLKILYVTGEESDRQVKMRGERLGLLAEHVFLLPETDLQTVFGTVEQMAPQILIVDSIQTMFSERIESAPGSVSQVREVAAQLMMLAKQTGVPVFVTGHVTKDGSIAGPKTLEHIVDTVLYFEGDRHHNHRIIRATKNRFGAVNEIGVFEMTGSGLVPVNNPSELFLQERPAGASGSAVTACIEGTRPMLLEVQALAGGSRAGTGRRMTQGFDHNRAALLIAVMEKRLGFQFGSDDIFVNVAGGLEIDEPAADLGVAAAIASSFRGIEIDRGTALFGEVGLTGEVRGVLQSAARVQEARALGFERLILPRSNLKGSDRMLGIRAVGVSNLEEAMEELFG